MRDFFVRKSRKKGRRRLAAAIKWSKTLANPLYFKMSETYKKKILAKGQNRLGCENRQ